jgi:hypothetical protein
MKIEEAIKKAGYKDRGSDELYATIWDDEKGNGAKFELELFLDPSFWQSLGSVMEWTMVYRRCGAKNMNDCDCDTDSRSLEEWKYQWHRFIDHLTEGGTAKTYFETLK